MHLYFFNFRGLHLNITWKPCFSFLFIYFGPFGRNIHFHTKFKKDKTKTTWNWWHKSNSFAHLIIWCTDFTLSSKFFERRTNKFFQCYTFFCKWKNVRVWEFNGHIASTNTAFRFKCTQKQIFTSLVNCNCLFAIDLRLTKIANRTCSLWTVFLCITLPNLKACFWETSQINMRV